VSGPAADILVAGVGNIFLGDDGFGCEVARRLAERPARAGIEVRDFGIRGFDLAHALAAGPRMAILIDATARGEPPGTLTVLEAELPDAPSVDDDPGALIDTHAMDPVRVLRLARALGGTPGRLLVVGLEPDSVALDDLGALGLGDAAAGAVEAAIGIVERLIDEAGLVPEPRQKGADDAGDAEPDEAQRAATARPVAGARDALGDGDPGRRAGRAGPAREVHAGAPAISARPGHVMRAADSSVGATADA
jgi:hydrogenase maturation protease